MERHNRKSHMLGEMTPATMEALKRASSPASGTGAAPSRSTPTSSELPAMDKLSLGPNGRSTQSAARPFPTRSTSAQRPAPNPSSQASLNGPLPPLPPPGSSGSSSALRPPPRLQSLQARPNTAGGAEIMSAGPRGLRRPGASALDRNSAYHSPVERSSAAYPSERRSAYNSPTDGGRSQWL